MKLRNRLLTVLLAFAGCLLLASCGDGQNTGAAAEKSESTSEKADDAKSKYLLTKEQYYDNGENIGLSYTYEYDDNGYLTKRTELYASGAVSYWLEYENDAEGRELKETLYDNDGMHIYRELEYDEAGNMIRKSEFEEDGTAGAQWQNEYDAAGNMIKSTIVFSTGRVYSIMEYEYDEHGNVTRYASLDGDGNVIESYRYEYELREDGLPNVTKIYDSENTVQRTKESEYDENGNLIKETTFDNQNEIMMIVKYTYTLPEAD